MTRNRGVVHSGDDEEDFVFKKRGLRRGNGTRKYTEDEEEDEYLEPVAVKEETEEDEGGRRKSQINYNEDDYFDEKLTGDDDLESSDTDLRPSKTVKLNYKKKAGSDDESFHGDESEDEDIDPDLDFSEENYEAAEERRAVNNFIVKDDSDDDDDDDEDDEDLISTRRRKRNKRQSSRSLLRSRGRSRKSRRLNLFASGDEDEENHEESRELTLAQEVQELEDSPVRTPPHRKFNFRERKEVNYQLPPPIVNEKLFENDVESGYVPATPRRGRKPASGPLRRLFPTVGPFGGGDVTSIFGENVPGVTAVGGGLDSDSSDDEIIPVGGSNRRNSLTQGTTMAGAFGKVEPKKKNSLADNDPLGIDMDIDFTAVGGLDNYIDQLKEMVALPLLYPEVYQRFGITPPRGVLFHGPPGTGKTLMARALAASCSSETNKITFFMRKGADILSKWVGEAERQLRLLFEEAKKQQPSIIFFDEIDGLAPVRSSKQEQIHASIVSTLLALMDGMDNRGQVIVIGATNRPDSVDPALRRPGRFDREFYFPLPDVLAREKILSIHTRKWNPPLDPEFIKKLAALTKGYGGADLRALCTESALNSIQRKYPQIYQSTEKLKIHPERINVIAKDFMKALDKIIPSSARSVSSVSAPLPDHIKPLLDEKLTMITSKLDKIIPKQKKISPLEESMYVDFTENDLDGGFKRQELVKKLSSARVFKPRMLISGPPGSGQVYLGQAILNHLEGFQVQSLDLSNLYNDSTRSIESAIIQMFIEARRHAPSIVYIPNIDIWYNSISESAKATLLGLLRSVQPNEKILLLCIAEEEHHDLDNELKGLFGFTEFNNIRLSNTFTRELYEKFFEPLWTALKLRPFEFGDLESRPKRQLPKLKVIGKKAEGTKELSKQEVRMQEKYDMRLKNSLKLKLSGLMELFKNRYKRFRKPTIDDNLLIYLFEPSMAPNGVDLPFVKDGDMILEVATGRHYYNMDLDIIEERLWNGFYSEPKQFLKDIEMIYKDAAVTNDRERLLKASEMYANAQVGVEEISTPELLAECRKMRAREIERQKLFLQKKNLIPDSVSEPVLSAVEEETIQVVSNGDEPTILEELESNGHHKEVETGAITEVEMTEESKPAEEEEAKVEVTLETSEEVKPVDEEEKVEPESEESEEEDEELDQELVEQLRKAIEVDLTLLASIQAQIVENAEFKYNIENLEELNAQLMEILWQDRQKWDRNETLRSIQSKVNEYHKYFQSTI